MPLTSVLTPAQDELLRFILGAEVLPTYREICAGLGYSNNAVNNHIQALVRKGWLTGCSASRTLHLPKTWPYPLALAMAWCPCCRSALDAGTCPRCRLVVSVQLAPGSPSPAPPGPPPKRFRRRTSREYRRRQQQKEATRV